MSLNQGLGFGVCVCVHMYMHMHKHVGIVSLWGLIHIVSLAEPHWVDQTRPNEWSFTLQPNWAENSVVDSSEELEISYTKCMSFP